MMLNDCINPQAILLIMSVVHTTLFANLLKHVLMHLCFCADYVQLRPHLFAKYIPNVLPACSLNDLGHYMQEAQQLQRDLSMHPDFIRLLISFLKLLVCTF